MQLIQFLAAWLLPGGAQCFAVDMATVDSSELDRASSSSSPSSSANAAGAGSGSASSSLSSPSSTSSVGRHSGFFKSRSRQENLSTTPLCLGSGGAGRRAIRGSRARTPAKQPQDQDAATMAPAKVKGDVVGRYLRKISRRLKKARSDNKGSPSPTPAAVDDTARERAESVARAISYCKDTLRRGTSPSRSRSRSPSPPPPPPSPSLDEWLHDRQDEIIATAATQCVDECSDPRPSPTRPRRAAGWPLGMQTMAKRFKESPSPCSGSASPSRDSSLAACDVAHGEESPQLRHGHGCRGESSSMSSLGEMEFLKTFDGDEEMFNHHFITVEL